MPGLDEMMIKAALRQDPQLGWVNARYFNTRQEQPCYFPNDTEVERRRSNEDSGLMLPSQPLRYQCIRCFKRLEESNAAMSKEGVMCLECYTLTLRPKLKP